MKKYINRRKRQTIQRHWGADVDNEEYLSSVEYPFGVFYFKLPMNARILNTRWMIDLQVPDGLSFCSGTTKYLKIISEEEQKDETGKCVRTFKQQYNPKTKTWVNFVGWDCSCAYLNSFRAVVSWLRRNEIIKEVSLHSIYHKNEGYFIRK